MLAYLIEASCAPPPSTATVQFSVVPEAAPGGPQQTEAIAGSVRGAKAGQRIVLFAKSGSWWVQPLSSKPFTEIRADGSWSSSTHMGTEYAALLVDASYAPPSTTDTLPRIGNGVIAAATITGKAASPSSSSSPKRIQFSGYEWEVRQLPSDSGGVMHVNSPSNAWTDAKGWLHLRIAKDGDSWTCAEVYLLRSLGYGTYSFAVHDMPALDPGSVLGMFTWDDVEAGQNHREIDMELSQWGDPASKSGQFVIQPYYVPANVFRFDTSTGPHRFSFRWDPGRVLFQTVKENPSQTVAEHLFTSGIPFPGGEAVHINLYVYGKSRTPQQNGAEVVIERFEFLP
jgi:hypothetical protein